MNLTMSDVKSNYNFLKQFFFKNELLINEYEEENRFTISFEYVEDFIATVDFTINEDFYDLECAFPVFIPESRREAVFYYFSLLNTQLRLGRFVIDMNNGRSSYRVSGLFDAYEEHIETLISFTLNMLNNQSKSVLGIAFGGDDPEAVFDQLNNYTPFEETVEN